MALKDPEEKEPTLSKLKEIIKQIEDKDNPFNKFKNTSIYHSFKYNYRILESTTSK